jgi:hypothetical protein
MMRASDENERLTKPSTGFSSYDAIIAACMKDVDRTLLRENLKLSVEARFEKFEKFMQYVEELRDAGQKSRSGKQSRSKG